MTVSPLASRTLDIPAGDRWNPRGGPVSGFTIHHNAGVNSWQGAMSPARVVSANYWISNEGDIIPHVDEDNRAWTSGMAGFPAGAEADFRNVTVEVSNSPEGVRSGSWAISAAAQDALSRLIGDVFRRYDLGPVERGTHGGVAVHQDFGPTECPGPYIMGHLDQIIADAEDYRTGEPTAAAAVKRRRSKMLMAYYKDAAGKGQGRWAIFGPNFWLELSTQKAANSFADQLGVKAFTTDAGGWAKFKSVSNG